MQKESSNIASKTEDGERQFPSADASIVKVFVLMPFGNKDEYQGGNLESDFIYNEIIVPGVRGAIPNASDSWRIVREVDKSEAGSITSFL
jgi:hypothetical protein